MEIQGLLNAGNRRWNSAGVVDTFEEEEPVDLAAVNREIAALRSQLASLEVQMQAYLKELGAGWASSLTFLGGRLPMPMQT
ncbi:MAG: hypothetical protein KatS3mg057_0732 [Herpetosiphonaceae bacterium]|nr:MAG: hypothetical protein KatS3mg057_0732 [Herpetosiphonaceae bacterium]